MILQESFKAITNKRQEWKIKHNPLEIIVMTICALIAGCEVLEDSCGFCHIKVEQKPIHMVNAWTNEQQMVLGKLPVEEKFNEITAVPQLLDMPDAAGCIIMADTMSCQKEMTKNDRKMRNRCFY